MSDKHHTENEFPPPPSPLPLPLSRSGSISGLRIALEMELLILSDTMRVKRSNEIYKVRAGERGAE